MHVCCRSECFMVFESDSSRSGHTCRRQQCLQLKRAGGASTKTSQERRLCFVDAVKREVTRPPLKSIDLDHLGAIALGWDCKTLCGAVSLCSTSPANMNLYHECYTAVNCHVLSHCAGTIHFRAQNAHVFSTVLSSLQTRHDFQLFCVFAQIWVLMLAHPFQHFR